MYIQSIPAANAAFNSRPLVPFALGLGAGVAISMHISGAYAVAAALLCFLGAYASVCFERKGIALFFAGLAFGVIRALGYAFMPRAEVAAALEDAQYSAAGVPTLLQGTLKSLCTRCDELFNEAAPLARAILLGDRSALGYFERDIFRICGVSHTLALSGLHVSVLSLLLVRCIPARLPRLRICTIGAFLCVYSALAGFPASLLRAAIMFMCILCAPLFARRNDTASALALAFIIIVSIKPLSIYSAGFCLSFSAVAGIAMLYAPIMRRMPKAFAPVATTLSATFGTLPFSLAFFGSFSTYSIISNIFIVPLITMALTLCFIALVLSYAALPLGRLAALPARLLLGAGEAISQSIAALPGSLVSISGLGLWGCIFYFGAMLMLSKYCLWQRRKRLAAAAALLLLAIAVAILQ